MIYKMKSYRYRFFDWITEILTILFLVLICIIPIYLILKFYPLTGVIPIHYNIYGTADSYGSKWTLIIWPIIALIIYAMLTILNGHPEMFNIPVKLTEKNESILVNIASRTIRIVKFFTILLFFFISIQNYEYILFKKSVINILPILLIVGIITIIPIISIIFLNKAK